MKYCTHCGKELIDEADYCTGCGCKTTNKTKFQCEQNDKPIKGKGLGFVLSFFLGIIGFFLTLFLGDEDCKRTGTITFIVCTIISVVGVIVYVALIASTFSYIY